MASMSPGFIEQSSPPGEIKVFQLLSQGNPHWRVLHSLDLAPWNRQKRTEIDFLVFIPDQGILVIEVKSHENIDFDGNKWSPNTIKGSPFKQAEDGAKSLYRSLTKLLPAPIDFPIVSLCIFTHSYFSIKKIASLHSHQLVDKAQIQSLASGKELCELLSSNMAKLIDEDPQIRPIKSRLTDRRVNALIETMLPIQKRSENNRRAIEHRTEETNKLLLLQQRPVIDLASENRHLVVTGGAGTGKTLIALQMASLRAISGERVALLCFNRLVSEWLIRECSSPSKPPNLIVGGIHSVLTQLLDIKIPRDHSQSFWDDEWLTIAEERITAPDFQVKCEVDYLILDEAQDVLVRPRLWALVSAFLSPAEAGGFCLLGDFKHQTISNEHNLAESMRQLSTHYGPTNLTLYNNCRNYGHVGRTALTLSGMGRETYREFLKGDGVHEYFDINTYSDPKNQLAQLKEIVQRFLQRGYREAEITILSTKADHKSIARQLVIEGVKIRPAREHVKGAVTYCSIHAFKGLENKVIIICDIDFEGTKRDLSLFYVGITRASEAAYVLLDEGSSDVITALIKEEFA